jgi:hypothetical protein
MILEWLKALVFGTLKWKKVRDKKAAEDDDVPGHFLRLFGLRWCQSNDTTDQQYT